MRLPLPRQMQVLYNRNYRLYWFGQLVSLTGTWMQAVAQGWVVLALTGSVAALGVVNFAVSLPTLFLTLTGGVMADRWDRRWLLIATQAGLMFCALLMALLLATDALTFEVLLAVSVLIGVITAFDLPTQQALVPELVAPREIPQAVAMNQVIFNGSRLLGPAVAGAMATRFSLASLYLGNGLSFLAVIASLLAIRVPGGRLQGGARGSMLHALREGLGYVHRSRLLRALLAVVALSVLLLFPAVAVLPPAYVRDVLHHGLEVNGLLMAISGGASLLGAFIMLWIPARRRGQAMLAAICAGATALAMLALTRSLWVAGAATGLSSLGFSLFMGLNATIVQQMVPGALRGRVMSVSSLMFHGVFPFAALAMSVLVARLGFTPVYLAAAGIYVLLATALLLSSGIVGGLPLTVEAEGERIPPRAPAATAAD
jgi:MFS family permease